MKKYKASENYEECYLRINELKKALKDSTNSDAINDPELQKVVSYMAKLSYNKNKVYLKKHGFELEDLVSIITLHSIAFIGLKKDFKTNKDKYTLMMRYITQRLSLFYKTMKRKFKTKEGVVEVSFEKYFNDFNDIEAVVENSEELGPEVEGNSGTMSMKEKKALKEKLKADLHLYKEDLQRLATSRFVEYKVRKAARKYCKKNNIDYISWAKDLIERNNLDINDFILEA